MDTYDFFPDDLAEWNISKTYGLLHEDPLEYLPEYFSAWNTLAKSTPSLVKSREMRNAVDEENEPYCLANRVDPGKQLLLQSKVWSEFMIFAVMPLLDHERLANDKEVSLAHVQLSFIASGYVWQDGDKGVPKILPQQVALPLYKVSEKLQCLPALNHASLALANWRKLDKNGDNTARNLKPLYCLPGGEGAEWFIAVVLEVETDLAPVWQVIPEVIKAVTERDEAAVCDNLSIIASCLSKSQESLSQIHDKVSPKTFYEDIRPFLFGWGWKESPLPDGLVYEGASDTPIKASVGGTSMLLKPIDYLLEIEKSKESSDFHRQDAAHFPGGFKKYINAIKKHTKLRQFVNERGSEELTEAYNSVVAGTLGFRTYHLGLATRWGWKESPLPDGLVYEGVSDTPIKAPAGGTSMLLKPIDYLLEMENSKVNERGSEELTEAYNSVVAATLGFRTYHLGIATRYALQISQKEDTSKKYESNCKVSPAGIDIHPTLYGLCEDTKNTFQ